MISPDIYANIDNSVFSQIIKGSFPIIPNKSKSLWSPLQLVKSVNSRVVKTSTSKEQIDNELLTHDFTYYGYHTTLDYELKISYESAKGFHQLLLIPVKVYDLQENMLLPEPKDKRSKVFLDFFSDEFERIKIRAEKVLANTTSERALRLYATRNLQIARKLFHDSSILFQSLSLRASSPVDQSDLYIIYTLNLFIIRTMVFFSKFFKHFIDEAPLIEENLRKELHNETPSYLKYPWLFEQKPNLYSSLNSFFSGSIVKDVISPYTQNSACGLTGIDISGDKSNIGLQHLKGRFRLNCNVNSFVDLFYQMIHEKKTGDDPYLDCEIQELIDVLSFLFIDKDGNQLNPESIRTILKPANFKKRPHPDDPRKLKI